MGIQGNAAVKTAGEVERITSDKPNFRTLKRNEQLVYDALKQSKTPLKAYEILEELQDHGLRAPMTIYRALDTLIMMGLVQKIVSLNAFVVIKPGHVTQTRAFLICKECTQAKEIILDTDQVSTLFAPVTLSTTDICIEAFGECHQVCGSQNKTKAMAND